MTAAELRPPATSQLLHLKKSGHVCRRGMTDIHSPQDLSFKKLAAADCIDMSAASPAFIGRKRFLCWSTASQWMSVE